MGMRGTSGTRAKLKSKTPEQYWLSWLGAWRSSALRSTVGPHEHAVRECGVSCSTPRHRGHPLIDAGKSYVWIGRSQQQLVIEDSRADVQGHDHMRTPAGRLCPLLYEGDSKVSMLVDSYHEV